MGICFFMLCSYIFNSWLIKNIRSYLISPSYISLRIFNFLYFLFFFCNSISYNLDFNCFIALSLFWCCDLCDWHWTTSPVGICVSLTAESVLLTCCPPAPEALNVSTLKSFLSIFISWTSSTSGKTATVQVDAVSYTHLTLPTICSV